MESERGRYCSSVVVRNKGRKSQLAAKIGPAVCSLSTLRFCSSAIHCCIPFHRPCHSLPPASHYLLFIHRPFRVLVTPAPRPAIASRIPKPRPRLQATPLTAVIARAPSRKTTFLPHHHHHQLENRRCQSSPTLPPTSSIPRLPVCPAQSPCLKHLQSASPPPSSASRCRDRAMLSNDNHG